MFSKSIGQRKSAILHPKRENQMMIKWTLAWYELDETIIVGDTDWFCITKDGFFSNARLRNEEKYIKAEILNISHPVLGDIKGVITVGLDYTIYLNNGEIIEVNAEEDPGKIYDTRYDVKDWTFGVFVNVLEEGEWFSQNHSDSFDREASHKELIDKYKTLLGISDAKWCR